MPTQPTPIYEQLWLLVVIGVVWLAMPRLKVDGLAFLLYLSLQALGRFFLSYLRANNELLLGLREAQIIALIVLIGVMPVGWWLWRRRGHVGAEAQGRYRCFLSND